MDLSKIRVPVPSHKLTVRLGSRVLTHRYNVAHTPRRAKVRTGCLCRYRDIWWRRCILTWARIEEAISIDAACREWDSLHLVYEPPRGSRQTWFNETVLFYIISSSIAFLADQILKYQESRVPLENWNCGIRQVGTEASRSIKRDRHSQKFSNRVL